MLLLITKPYATIHNYISKQELQGILNSKCTNDKIMNCVTERMHTLNFLSFLLMHARNINRVHFSSYIL